jgi:hypothetical protein
MSKKAQKAKQAKNKPSKPVARSARKKAAKKALRRAAASPPAGPSNVSYKRTGVATIFVYKIGDEYRVRTSPQLLGCGPGSIEWTVVNLTSEEMPEVELTWPNGSPWGGRPIPIKGGNARLSLAGAKEGRFKYNVTCNGYTEDPEVQWPEN